MVKRITLFVLLLGLCLNMQAQIKLRYGPNIDEGWGDASSIVTPYVSFPVAFVSPYAGNRITKVRIGVKAAGTNAYLYIKNHASDSRYIYHQKIDSLKSGWNDIILDTPFDITGTDDIAIGYKASFADAGGVGYSKEKFSDGDIVYYNSENKWTSTGGSVCIQAIVEGSNLPQNEMLIGKVASQSVNYGVKNVTFMGVVRNVGVNNVNGYTLKYSVDKDSSYLKVDRTVEVNASDTFAITIPSEVSGVHAVTISIDKVNGMSDYYLPNDIATATLTVNDKALMHRVVCDEFTGMWCGWCPRGLVGLELMKKNHPDQFIAISVHGNDKLEIDSIQNYSYRPFIDSCPSAPMCKVDRKFSGDPYYDIEKIFNMAVSSENHIGYDMTATWNADSSGVNVTSTYFSDIDIDAPLYFMAYTVTEDSITGYAQHNYYAGGSNGAFYGWENKGDVTTDCYYNDLARAVYSNFEGDECRHEPMKALEKYQYTYTVPIPPTVVNKKQIHIVGQLIDHKSGYILNAMSVRPLSDSVPSDVVKVKSDDVNIGISRLDNRVEIIASGSGARDLFAYIYNAMGMLVGKQRIESGSAQLKLSSHGMYVVDVMKSNKSIRTIKFMY